MSLDHNSSASLGTPSPADKQKTSKTRLPHRSWDSHLHVFEPHSLNYPGAPYRPIPSDISQTLAFEATLGLRNIVLVQPSCYGCNNTYLLQALTKLGDRRARGVVAFGPYTTAARTLRSWHRLGVRGVRVNLKSVDATMDRAAFETLLTRYADAIRPLGWVLQLYVPMELAVWLEDFAAALEVKICLDHFGCPDLSSTSTSSSSSSSVSSFTSETPIHPYDIRGFRSLINLLAQGKTYVKFSAPYGISDDPTLGDLAPLAKELLRVAGMARLVFATDWPHTRFNGLNIELFMAQCVEWCNHDNVLIGRLFQGNAEDLWDAKETGSGSGSASLR